MTKDGRKWVFNVYYKDLSGETQKFKSKKYLTKKEAIEEEMKFNLSLDQNFNHRYMTFKELYLSFYEYQKDKVRETTIKTYRDRIKYLDILGKVKLNELNINHIEQWKKEVDKFKLSTGYKNDIFKFLKALLNYGAKWYDFNFNQMYNKMTNFKNPSELQKEMLFYTYDEFQKFLSVENNLIFKTLFETLYFMGLRKGELRGLQWKDINFENKTMSIRKQISSMHSSVNYKMLPLKTVNSNRVLPINNLLLSDLKKVFEQVSKFKNFNYNWFVFGDELPISKDPIRIRKNNNAKLALVKEIRVHDFRHSCASLLINNGANITIVAKYLGHTKIDETLNTYSHMYKSKLEDVVSIIDELNSNKISTKKSTSVKVVDFFDENIIIKELSKKL